MGEILLTATICTELVFNLHEDIQLSIDKQWQVKCYLYTDKVNPL